MKLTNRKRKTHLSGDQLFALARVWRQLDSTKPHLCNWLKAGLTEAEVAKRMHWSVVSLRAYMKPFKDELKEAGITAPKNWGVAR